MTIQSRTEPTIFVTVVPEGAAAQRVELSDKVLSFVYEDCEHKADKLVLSIDNGDLTAFDEPLWKKGNVLQVSWGYPGDMAPTREVVIQKVTGGQVLAVEGYARSVLMNKVTRSRTFEGLSRSAVVRKIAQENGYGPAQQYIDDSREALPVITQALMTDAQFLRALAAREGFEFYVDFDGLHFHPRRFGQRPMRVLRWFTAPEVGEMISFHVDNDVTAKPGAVSVRGRDPVKKVDLHERASNAGTRRDSLAPTIEIVDPETGATRLERRNLSEETQRTTEASPATAKRQADAAYRAAQHATIELSATVVGDPSLLAKSVVEIQGIGQRLSGKYYLREAKHKIDGSGFTIDCRFLRDGHSEAGGVATKGKLNRASAAAADPQALRAFEVVDRETGRTRIEYRATHGRSAQGES